jgi:hypothetical protein
MHRKLVAAVVAVAAAGLGIGGASVAAQGPSNVSQPFVLNLISRATAINKVVDTGPTGLQPRRPVRVLGPVLPRERA